MEIIKVEGLNVSYSNKSIIKDFSMPFIKNRITAIIGPSGCGKSTLLTVLNQMLEEHGGSYTGQVLFKNRDINTYNKDSIRKMIGMVYQNLHHSPCLYIKI